MESCRTRQYSDACIQTSLDVSATRLQDSMIVKTTPIANRSKRVTYIDQTASGLYLDDSASRRVYPRTPISRLKTQLSFVPKHMLNSSPSALVEPQRRVVSLPDQLGPELISQRIANSLVASSRNVSMPVSLQRFRQAGLAFEEYPGTDSSTSVSYEEECSIPQIYTHANDLLHTPSLSSTPNSIEIVDGGFHVPDAFLRNQSHSMGTMDTVSKDWLTWSNSPPRPIPALHGPSSLPYARCPSGAEGTIIEEPSSVPGLIWGLKNTGSSVQTEHILEHEKPRTLGHDSPNPNQKHSLEAHPPTYHGHARNTQELLSVGALPGLACNKHENLPANKSGKHEVSTLEQSDAMIHHGCVQYGEAESSVSTTASDAVVLNEQNALRSRKGYSQYGDPGDLLLHQQLCQIPDSLLHAILRERSRARNDAAVFSGSNLSCPDMLYRSSGIDNMETATPREMRQCHSSSSHDQSTILLARNTTPQNIIPTAPDSASSLWLSEASPLLSNNLITFKPPLSERSSISALQLASLNLQAPAESLESLSDQLRRLILRQQKLDCTTTSFPCNRDFAQCPFHEQAASAVPSGATSNIMPAAVAPKPEMPINLHDLVARRMGGRSPIEISSSMLPNGGPATCYVSEYVKGSLTPEMDTDTAASLSNERQKQYSNRENTMIGKRHPRSIPLTRLLERKLASVPEETSFVGTSEEVQNGASPPVLTPILTSVKKKDYDFTELRSPLEETIAEESRCSEIGLADNADRKVLQPVRQRMQHVKQKGQNTSTAKATSSKAYERRTKQNDENVHELDSPMKTSTRKQKMTNKHARIVARGFGPQKTRR